MSGLCDFKIVLEIATCFKEILETEGPIAINTNILSHYLWDAREHEPNDIFIIGKANEKITMDCIIELLNTLCTTDKYKEYFESDRHYFFEGMYKDTSFNNMKTYAFSWGS